MTSHHLPILGPRTPLEWTGSRLPHNRVTLTIAAPTPMARMDDEAYP